MGIDCRAALIGSAVLSACVSPPYEPPDAGIVDASVAAPDASVPPALDAGAELDAGLSPPDAILGHRVFVSTGLEPADLGGLGGADARCRGYARDAALGGRWVAWLSTATVSAKARVADGPWFLTDGSTVAVSTEAMLGGGVLAHAIDHTETGEPLSDGALRVWTGTDRTGAPDRETCGGWRSVAGYTRVGRADRSDVEWTDSAPAPCSLRLRLYCFEVP